MCDSIQTVAVIQRGRFPTQSNMSSHTETGKSRERQMGERKAAQGRRSRVRRGGGEKKVGETGSESKKQTERRKVSPRGELNDINDVLV